jgi:hypothetical protein
MIRVLAVSDRVQEHIYSPSVRSRYSDIQVVFGCGDLPVYYLEYIVSALSRVPVLYVRGNHDDHPVYMSNGRVARRAEGCLDLDGQVVFQSGLYVAGIEGAMRYRPDGACMYNDRQIAVKLLQMAPRLCLIRLLHGRYLDVLVTHAPPFGIHDRSDLAHTGFKPFLPFMRCFRPRYLLHGHVHNYNPTAVTQSRYHRTFVINVYPYVVVDIPLVASRSARSRVRGWLEAQNGRRADRG